MFHGHLHYSCLSCLLHLLFSPRGFALVWSPIRHCRSRSLPHFLTLPPCFELCAIESVGASSSPGKGHHFCFSLSSFLVLNLLNVWSSHLVVLFKLNLRIGGVLLNITCPIHLFTLNRTYILIKREHIYGIADLHGTAA